MVPRTLTSLIALAALVALVGSPFSVAAFAQASCTEEIGRQDAALQQFGGEAQREGIGFAADDVGRIALDKMKANLKGDPTADAYEQFKQEWDNYQGWVEKGKKFRAILDRMSQCLGEGRNVSACSSELVEYNTTAEQLLSRSHDAVQKWIESLENDNITRAAQRVERALGVMEQLTTNAGNLATGAISGGMDNCLRDYNQRVQNAQSGDPVDASQVGEPAAGKKGKAPGTGEETPPKEGMSRGAKAAIGMAAGAGLGTAVALAASQYADSLTDASGGGRCSNRNCIVSVMSNSCDCAGAVSVSCPGPVQTAASGPCFSNGMYCPENYSCNNGRCEPVSTGRCR